MCKNNPIEDKKMSNVYKKRNISKDLSHYTSFQLNFIVIVPCLGGENAGWQIPVKCVPGKNKLTLISFKDILRVI